VNERTAIDLVPNLVRSHRRNGRSVYDREAKRELVRRCLQPGVSLAATALAHGLNANLLRRWVVQQTGRARRAPPQANLVPVTTAAGPRTPPAPGEWDLELLFAGSTIRLRGRIEAETLRTVLDCLAAHA
jgi:transposase-like protein